MNNKNTINMYELIIITLYLKNEIFPPSISLGSLLLLLYDDHDASSKKERSATM